MWNPGRGERKENETLMANIKSAEKRIRTSAKKKSRNRAVRSKLRNVLKNEREQGTAATLPQAASEIDRARAKGVIHRKTASRYKSRLAKTLAKKGAPAK